MAVALLFGISACDHRVWKFSWFDLIRVALIGFFGFEAGLVLNDYVDRQYDKKDIESDKLTGTGGFLKPPHRAGSHTAEPCIGTFFGFCRHYRRSHRNTTLSAFAHGNPDYGL